MFSMRDEVLSIVESSFDLGDEGVKIAGELVHVVRVGGTEREYGQGEEAFTLPTRPS